MTTTSPDLDPFQEAALRELRTHVEQRMRLRRRRRRLVPALSAAAAAVAVAGTAIATAVHPTPAYAVTTTAGGDISITIHHLTDPQGLEDALRAKGLDAHVAYTPRDRDADNKLVLPRPSDAMPPTDADPVPSIVFGTDRLTDEQRALCDIDAGGSPATVGRSGGDYRITIPSTSPLQDRFFAITGVTTNAMTVSYWSADGRHACLVR